MNFQDTKKIPQLQIAAAQSVGSNLVINDNIGATISMRPRQASDNQFRNDFQVIPSQEFQLRHTSTRTRPLSHNFENQTVRGSWQSMRQHLNLSPISLPQNPFQQGSSSQLDAAQISRRNPLQRMQEGSQPSVTTEQKAQVNSTSSKGDDVKTNQQSMHLLPQNKSKQRRYITLSTVPLMEEIIIGLDKPPQLTEWTENKELEPVDLDCFTVPTLKLSKDTKNVDNGNPFGYKDFYSLNQLPTSDSDHALTSSSIPDLLAANDEDEELQSTNSAREQAIKVSQIIIDLITNEYGVTPSSIQTKQDVVDLVTQHEIIDYARKHFRRQTVKKVNLTIEETLAFSDQPLTKALIHTKSSLKQVGETLSTLILQFIGVIPGHLQNQIAYTFLRIIQSHIELVDEAYFQLIRAATDNPNQKWKENAYLLFSLMCNLFCPSESAYLYILSWIVKHLVYDAFKVREFFSFTLIRFHNRHLLGNETNEITIEMIDDLIEPQEQVTFFNCTIYEIMWFQRRKYPKLPLPLPLYLIIRELHHKDAVKTANLLDSPYTPAKVEQLSEQILYEHETLETCTIGELMALLKLWLRSIIDPIIPKSSTDRFLSYEKAADFISILPNVNRDSLRYVIGFLQDISNNDDDNNSTTSKLTDQFASLLCNANKLWPDKEKIDQITERENSFIKEVILNYPTNDIYPLSDDLLEFGALKEKL